MKPKCCNHRLLPNNMQLKIKTNQQTKMSFLVRQWALHGCYFYIKDHINQLLINTFTRLSALKKRQYLDGLGFIIVTYTWKVVSNVQKVSSTPFWTLQIPLILASSDDTVLWSCDWAYRESPHHHSPCLTRARIRRASFSYVSGEYFHLVSTLPPD